MRYQTLSTPLGTMILATADAAISGVWFEGQSHFEGIGVGWIPDPHDPLLERAATQLEQYFSGNRRQFDLPLGPRGTEFQRMVWKHIARVDYGTTTTYGELARELGRPGSARAVGSATGRNPWTIVVPCHRILASDGSLTGYAGGIAKKQALLEMEDAPIA